MDIQKDDEYANKYGSVIVISVTDEYGVHFTDCNSGHDSYMSKGCFLHTFKKAAK